MPISRMSLCAAAVIALATASNGLAQPTTIKLSNVRNVAPALAPRDFKITAPPLNSWHIKVPMMKPTAIEAAASEIAKRVAGKSVGYAITLIAADGTTKSIAGGQARRAPDGGERAMTPTDDITIASVSKMITAAAIMRTATAKKIDVATAAAYQYMPKDWAYDDSFKTVTIQQLLRHTGGVRDTTCGLAIAELKACAAKPVVSDKSVLYQNSNYALLRVVLVGMYNLPLDDKIATVYTGIANVLVLQPLGFTKSCASPTSSPALSYKSTKDNGAVEGTDPYYAPNYDFSAVKAGQLWWDMTEVCGSQGWNLNSVELAKLAHGLMRTYKVTPVEVVAQMRKNQLGIWYTKYSNGEFGFAHGGYHPAGGNQGEINTLAMTYSTNGFSVGAVFNSRYNGNYGEDIAAGIKAGLFASN